MRSGFVEQVRRTVIHEVSHHLGIADVQLGKIGWAVCRAGQRGTITNMAAHWWKHKLAPRIQLFTIGCTMLLAGFVIPPVLKLFGDSTLPIGSSGWWGWTIGSAMIAAWALILISKSGSRDH